MPDSFVDTHTVILVTRSGLNFIGRDKSIFLRPAKPFVPLNSTKRINVNLPLIGSLSLWQDAITAEETLFDYPPGQGHANFFFPDHVPVFSDELTEANFSAEARARCNGSLLCLYDSRETGDVDLGAVTEQERESFIAEQAGIGEFFFFFPVCMEFLFFVLSKRQIKRGNTAVYSLTGSAVWYGYFVWNWNMRDILRCSLQWNIVGEFRAQTIQHWITQSIRITVLYCLSQVLIHKKMMVYLGDF